MPSEIVTNCDVCGVQKLGTNKWFIASSPATGRTLTFCHWTASKALKPGFKSLCGHGCVHVVTDRFLTTFTSKKSVKPEIKEAVQETVTVPLETSPVQVVEETKEPEKEDKEA